MEAVSRPVKVCVPEGLHMRPCSLLQAAAAGFGGKVTLTCGDRAADVKSIFDLLSLGMATGEEGELRVEGEGGAALIATLGRMFDTDFATDDGG